MNENGSRILVSFYTYNVVSPHVMLYTCTHCVLVLLVHIVYLYYLYTLYSLYTCTYYLYTLYSLYTCTLCRLVHIVFIVYLSLILVHIVFIVYLYLLLVHIVYLYTLYAFILYTCLACISLVVKNGLSLSGLSSPFSFFSANQRALNLYSRKLYKKDRTLHFSWALHRHGRGIKSCNWRKLNC